MITLASLAPRPAAQPVPTLFHRLALTAATALMLSVSIAPAVAQEQPGGGTAPSFVIADGQGGATASDAAGLMARARQQGRMLITVGLDAAFQPEGTLSPGELATQRSRIGDAQQRVADALGLDEGISRYRTVPFITLQATPEQVRILLELPGITTIIEEVAVPPLLNESAPLINARRAWNLGFTGSGWAVAVLDTGTQLDHNAFAHATIRGACYSRTTEGVSVSLCPNGEDSQIGRSAGRACRPVSLSGCDHGTHVAGIAMGNRTSRRGVANAADLYSFQVFHRRDLDVNCAPRSAPCVRTWPADLVDAMERLLAQDEAGVRPRIAAVNMSLGGGQYTTSCDSVSPHLTAVIQNLRSRGIPTVIASGNDGYNGAVAWPACISAAITVGNSTKQDDIAPSSNHARMVDLMAPGTDISAPWYRRLMTNRITTKTGTSMAAPQVAGAWAVLRQAHPQATVDEVLRALVCTGEAVTRNNLPRPRIDVNEARRFLNNPAVRRVWTFATDRQVQQWTPDLGNWVRVTDFMRARADRNHVWYVASSPFCAGNMTVTAQVRRVDPDSNTNWNSGLMLFSSVDDGANMTGMWFAFNKANGGSAVIWALDGWNGLSNAGAARLLCNRAAPSVNVGGVNTLRVVSTNGVHRFFINGTEVCGATDASFNAGQVSVAMAAPANSPGHIYQIRRLEAEVLVPATPPATGLTLAALSDDGSIPVPVGMSPLGIASLD